MSAKAYLVAPFVQPTQGTPAPFGTATRDAQLRAGAPRMQRCTGCQTVTPIEGAWDVTVGQCRGCALVVTPGQDDRIMIAESRLRQGHRDGADLVGLLREAVKRSPSIGQVMIDRLASLGWESERQVCIALRDFGRTRVVVLPESL